MFCHRPLRSNEVVETFPVGRRLAFDAAKGRLWVVCASCERWNLTPLEERWEAVETCEEIFRATRVRTSSENIGLARHAEGLELVRIGKPLRPEFAAWRYGDQFGTRRRRHIVLYTAAGLGLAGGVVVGGALGGFFGANAAFVSANWANIWNMYRPTVRFRPCDGQLRRLNMLALSTARIQSTADETGFRVQTGKGWLGTNKKEWFEGEDAHRAISAILPKINEMGGKPKIVQEAVSRIESQGHPQRFVSSVVARKTYNYRGVPGHIYTMPKPTRLALEMALHEEQERRALEGELWRLEKAWEEAEEIAAISDSLLLPKGAGDFLAQHSQGGAKDEP